MERKNPFESLRQPGVVGDVASKEFKTTTVYAQGASATLQIRTAELAPGRFDFGFYLQIGDLVRQMLPGEGSGWYSSEKDATLFALGHIRYGSVELPPDMKLAIDAYISKLRNVSLFDELN